MAGHSKFKNIMHRKGRADSARSKLFSKLSREITVAAKHGMPDPAFNPRLRLAVATANYKVSAGEYGQFAAAVATRYSGRFGGLPAVHYFTIWNEPNHRNFLKPTSAAPGVYRKMVDTALPLIRRHGPSGVRIFVGELAPVGRAPVSMGPKAFFRRWLCLNSRLRKSRGSSACRRFKRIDADVHLLGEAADRVSTLDGTVLDQCFGHGALLEGIGARDIPVHITLVEDLPARHCLVGIHGLADFDIRVRLVAEPPAGSVDIDGTGTLTPRTE